MQSDPIYKIPFLTRCTSNGHYVQYKEGYWAGIIDGCLIILPCPFGYCSCHKLANESTKSSGCFFNVVNKTSNDVCANYRTGILCGKCQKNYSVGIKTFVCVPRKSTISCTVTTILSFVFTFLACILILYFNPGLDNEIRGPLFFFQVLPLFFPPVQYTAKSTLDVYDLVHFLASIFGFTLPFFGYFFSHCYILDNLDNLDMLLASFTSPLIAFTVFVVFMLLTKQRIIFIRRKNAVQSFWVLLLLMYSSLMTTSLNIINCLNVAGSNRLFLQGSVKCFEKMHLPLFVIACILLLLGIFIPIVIFDLTKKNRLKIAPHYLDTLTNNLKKESTFWWSVDLLRRLLVVAVGNLIKKWKIKQVICICVNIMFFE